jgi:hypothetical protein
VSINLGTDSGIGKLTLPKTNRLSVQDLQELKAKLNLNKPEDLALIRAVMTNEHEHNHFRSAVGSPLGITAYVLTGLQTTAAREIIRSISKRNEEVYIPIPTWQMGINPIENDRGILSEFKIWKRVSDFLALMFTEKYENTNLNDIKSVIEGYMIVKSQQPAEGRTFPLTPDCYSSSRIFEALATLDEIINLSMAGYTNQESNLICGRRHGGTYYSLINFLFKDYGFDPWTAKLVLTLSLLTPIDPCYDEKSGYKNCWEDIFPSWRILKIASAIKKIGKVGQNEVFDDSALERYLDKICAMLSWPSVRSFIDIGANTDLRKYYQEHNSWLHQILMETKNPIFNYILEIHKLISKISEQSLIYKFFGIINDSQISELNRRVLPPFIIYENQVKQPSWLNSDTVDVMFDYYLLSVAINEMLTSNSIRFTKRICEIWFNDRSYAELFLSSFWLIHFQKDIHYFRGLQC